MPFDGQPVLHGETLSLRPLREDDFEPLYEVASDRLLWEQHPHSDRYKPDVFRAFFDDAIASGGALLITTRDGTVIGSSRYDHYDEAESEVEVGWTFLARSHWGGDTNRELKSLMLGHAFRFVDRVVFLVGPGNLRSQRAVEKIGGRRVGTRLDDSGDEDVLFELRRSDWIRPG
jgi:N-acetyltransferase